MIRLSQHLAQFANGTDDIPAAAYFSPPRTSIRLDFKALGTATICMVLAAFQTGAALGISSLNRI
jgi:DNA-binding LacI/PurR family transcriptional regulator